MWVAPTAIPAAEAAAAANPRSNKRRGRMGNLLTLVVVLAVLIVAGNCFQKEKKPSGKCKTCPEYRYCGGGKPRCARRNETL